MSTELKIQPLPELPDYIALHHDMNYRHAAREYAQKAVHEASAKWGERVAELEQYQIEAECFRLWVHEAWHSPGDVMRLLATCETKEDYIAKLMPIVQQRIDAIDAAQSKEQS